MIVDSSAIVAIVRAEPGYEKVLAELEAADSVAIGSPTLVETGMVLTGRLGLDARALLERFVQDFGVMVIPFGEAHWREALDAFRRFGKKRHLALGTDLLHEESSAPMIPQRIRPGPSGLMLVSMPHEPRLDEVVGHGAAHQAFPIAKSDRNRFQPSRSEIVDYPPLRGLGSSRPSS